MEHLDYKQYEKLGPFEIKDFVAKVATKSAEDSSLTYLNAGRGNPNWVATEPREAFFLLGQFAITESKRVFDLPPGVGGMPKGERHCRRGWRRGSPSTRTCRARPSCNGWCRGR